jgi:Uncharacterised nucleotidyltransferase
VRPAPRYVPNVKQPTCQIIRGVAALGLCESEMLVDAPLDDEAWAELISEAGRNGLIGLLSTAIDSGVLPATERQTATSRTFNLAAVAHVLGLEGLLLSVSKLLETAGIDSRVLKGAAHAYLLYDSPAQRPYGDVDLLVRGSDFVATIELLHTEGIVRRKAELRPGFDVKFGKGATLQTPRGQGVDLHRTFLTGPFALTVDADGLFERSQPIDVGGTTLAALGREELFLHACLSTAIADLEPRLLAHRDVALAAMDLALDFDRLLDVAAKWRAVAAMCLGIRNSWSALALTSTNHLIEFSTSYQASAKEQRVLDVYLRSDRRWAHQAVAAFPLVTGWRNRFAYVRAVVFPQQSALSSRRTSHMARLRNAVPGRSDR